MFLLTLILKFKMGTMLTKERRKVFEGFGDLWIKLTRLNLLGGLHYIDRRIGRKNGLQNQEREAPTWVTQL